jgi:DNA-binding NarL/FixJ family response regulator
MVMAFDTFVPSSSAVAQWTAGESAPARALSPPQLVSMLWLGLKRGAFRVAKTVTAATEVTVTIVHGAKVPPFSSAMDRSSNMLEDVLRGTLQKQVGYDHGVAPSTVALALKQALDRMGCFGRFSRVPLAIPMLAHAARRPQLLAARVLGAAPTRPGDECLVGIERTDGLLANRLSPCEYAVATALLEGKSYEEIAQVRGTSLRTVANQMGAVGRKLGTRGRFDLLMATVLMSSAEDTRATTPPVSGTELQADVTIPLVG